MAKSGKPSIFISYSNKDIDSVGELRAALEQQHLDVVNPEISIGDNVSQAIGKSLERADAMVVMISPASASSRWVEREVQYALTQLRFKGRVIPLVLEEPKKSELPWILEKFQRVSGTDFVNAAKIIRRALTKPVVTNARSRRGAAR